MRITNNHVFFWDTEFSNFHPVKINYKGKEFLTTEHAFMWEKANFFEDQEIADKILEVKHPREAKKLGRQIEAFDATRWSEVCYKIMLDVNRPKWSDNSRLTELLLSTGKRVMVEASPYDKVWGIGMKQDDAGVDDESNWQGQNLLGKVLDELREELLTLKK
jgi:ribA/ribD-fused uncharacterized protein